MAKKNKTISPPKKNKSKLSTEEKIKQAARIVFTKKGYAATKTRDIAKEADMNLALLNYYFRSKEKLFQLIMFERLEELFHSLRTVMQDDDTSLEKKLELLVDYYTEMLVLEPNFPLFMLSEIQAEPELVLGKLQVKSMLMKSVFMKQLQDALHKKKNPTPPLHFLLNFLGLTVFPFVAKPLFMGLSSMDEAQFNENMKLRKRLIPKWIKAMIKTI